MKIINSSNLRAVQRLVDRKETVDPEIDRQVARIVNGVRRRGDRALRNYARRFDNVAGALEISRRAMQQGARKAPPAAAFCMNLRREIVSPARFALLFMKSLVNLESLIEFP